MSTKQPHPIIYVGDCPLGKGVFAADHITKGREILRFSGDRITFAESLSKGAREGDVLQVGQEWYLDLEPPAVFVNHSCQPNSGLAPGNRLIAVEDILAGDEIRYDYSTTMLERHWTMECDCRSSPCRKMIADFDTLPIEIQRRYLELGIVQEFIAVKVAQGGK